MDDLISRQAAIDAIDRYYKDKKYIIRSRTILSAICIDMKNTMDSLPSAQPERKGRWIQKPNIFGVAYCSECDYELHTNDTNFCPNCGADMRERRENGQAIDLCRGCD